MRGALIAMGLVPQPLPADPPGRRHALASLSDGALAFVDVSEPRQQGRRPLAELLRSLPDDAARSRVMLGRTGSGHVSPQEREWLRHLGFADVVPDWVGGPERTVLRRVLRWAATTTGLDEPAPEDLVRYARVLSASDDAVAARSLVWGLTGESPEVFVGRLATWLDVADRRWHFADYPRCFVGSEAVEQLSARLKRPPREIVALGQALGELGLLAHVVQEHPFLDQDLFYRLAWSPALDAVDLARLWQTVQEGLPGLTATRTHQGRSYPDCFVGGELVAWVAERLGLHRVDAWLALYRMARWGALEHVTHARPFVDGAFFYRWRGEPTAGS